MDETNHEALREALLHVERLREKERLAREQMETLIIGLQILNESSSVAQMFHEILDALKKVIPFDCAAILVGSPGETLSTAICTDERLQFSSVPAPQVIKRALAGRGAAITDLTRVPDWPGVQSKSASDALLSAVVTPLPGLSEPMVVVCASTEPARFKKPELKLLQTFSPLATQAVQRAGEMEELNILVNKLDYYAHFDMLTGLPNRTLFDERLSEANSQNLPFSVLFVDLDNFKTVNDTYGHAAGDILLSEIAFRLSSVLEGQDSVARMGGDEFAILLRKERTLEQVYQLCDAILNRVSEPVYFAKSCVDPSASIGICMCHGDSETTQTIMQNADIALYESKAQGRARYCLFNFEMKRQLDRRSDIESRLRVALEHNQFRLVYQPIFDGDTLQCNAMEALIRWGDEGAIRYRPDEFIPVAEATGDIRAIGLWVLQTALNEMSGWLQEKSDRTVAINLSDLQLRDPDLSTEFIQTIASADIPAAQIKLELSERIVAADIDSVVKENLEALRACGFLFAYDDFGTGQSSFMHLQKLPGTTLKIDRVFISGMLLSDEALKLVEGMVNFAQALGLEVVAEGVETREQVGALQQLGCDYLQGFYLAKPLTLDACLQFLSIQSSDNAPRSAIGGI